MALKPTGGCAPIGAHTDLLCPRFSRKPRTLTSPTRLGCAFGPPRILRSHASDESLEVTWNGRTTPLARRDDRAGRDIGCSHSLPAQNHLRLHNQQWVTPTTNRRFGRIKKRLRRCAGEDPIRTAVSSLQLSVQARYACAQPARCRNAPTLCNAGSQRKAGRWL